MANICIAHHVDDKADAERLADICRFLEFEVAVCSEQSMAGNDLPLEELGEADVMLALWTPSSRRCGWVVAQCRSLKDSTQMVVAATPAARDFALPLLIHESCLVWLESSRGRLSADKVGLLFSEIGQRSGRLGLGQCVAAILRGKRTERNHELSTWAAISLDDPLAHTVQSALETNDTRKLHTRLVKLLRGPRRAAKRPTYVSSNSSAPRPQSSFASRKLAYAAAGLVSIGVAGGVFSNLIGDLSVAQTDLVETAAIAEPRPSEVKFASLEHLSDGRAPITANDTAFEPISLVETPEAAVLSVTIPESDAVDPETGALELPFDALDSDVEDLETLSSVSDDIEPIDEPVLIEDPYDSLYFPAAGPDPEPVIEELPESFEEAELLLPYIASEHGPGDIFTDRLGDETGAPEMVVIPAGSFSMGSPLAERGRDPGEGPQKTISIARPFAVGKYEVSVAEFSKFTEATGYSGGEQCQTYRNNAWDWRSDRNFKNPGFDQKGNHPVTCVSWPAAIAYVTWLSEETGAPYRLLSEAEWEYVARAGSKDTYFFGNDADAGCAYMNGADESSGDARKTSLAMNCKDGVTYTAPTGSYLPNAFGLYDLHGSVWEWTTDAWFASISGVPKDGTARMTGESRSAFVRGGSWFTLEFWLRSASRNKFAPEDRRNDVGFRIARDL